jgi:hypothetical protein
MIKEDEIIRLAETGLGYEDIAYRTGYDKTVCREYVMGYGLTRRQHQLLMVIQAHRDDFGTYPSRGQMADYMGCRTNTIADMLDGLKLRGALACTYPIRMTRIGLAWATFQRTPDEEREVRID